MSDRCFVDSNVLVYAHDRSTGVKHERAQNLLGQLWQDGSGVLSTQVLQEVCVNLRRKALKPLSIEEVRAIVQDYLAWEVVTNSQESILQALDTERRFRISFWDALVVQAAEGSGCEILYSEDLNHGQVFDSVRVVNPFRD